MEEAPLVPEAVRRHYHQPVVELADRGRIVVAVDLLYQVGRVSHPLPLHTAVVDHLRVRAPIHCGSAHTCSVWNLAGPHVVIIATSRASRPRPITTRPIRRRLLRASNVHQRPPR